MKKYFQSIAYILCLFGGLYALHVALISYENPFDIYENPLVWVILIVLVTVVILKEILNIVSLEKTEKLEVEKQGIDPATIDRYAEWKKFLQRWTKTKSIEDEEEIILDHNYDGIKELDNSLPPWWVYMFYATIVYGICYLGYYHIFDGDNQATEYKKEVAAAMRELEKNKEEGGKTNVKIIDANTATLLTDEASLKRGRAIFNMNCASCHQKDGGGGIGPNLTDEYWILGGDMKSVFSTVSNGGRSGKGMVAWKSTLKSVDVEKVSSYVMSLQGTSPQKPKAPEGDLWEE